MPLALVRQALSQRAKSHDDIIRGVGARLPWVWDQLCFGAAMREIGSDAFLDVVNGVRGVGNAAGIGSGWKTDNQGNPSFNMGTIHYVEYPDHPVHDRPDTALTAMVRYKIIGATANSGVLTLPHTTGASPWMTWGIIAPATSIRAVRGHLTVDGTPTTTAVSGTVIAVRLDVTVFLRWRSGEAPQIDVYDERGQLLSQVVHGSALTGSLTYDASKGIRINATDTATQRGNNHYSQALLWSRRLTDTETVALTVDPYGWYSPRRHTVGISSPFPIFHSTTTQTVFRVVGYAMFATTGERDAMQAEVQAWLDAHSGGRATASAHTVNVAGSPYALSAGQATPDLMDEADPPTGPHPGLTWSYAVASKELRDSFGALGGGSAWAAALEGSQLGEVTT